MQAFSGLQQPNYAMNFAFAALEMFILTPFPFIFFGMTKKKFLCPSLTFVFSRKTKIK